MRLLRALLSACALLLACEEPKLPKSWRVTYARVLGVRAEVIGDEERATPEPGERMRARVLIVGDQPIERLSYALLACPASPPRGELPSCAGEPFFVDRSDIAGSLSSSLELVVELAVPEASALDGAERVLIAGTICTDGTAAPEEGGEGGCEGASVEPVTFTAHVVLALDDDDVNHNPVLADDAIRFDDHVWAPHVPLDLPADDDAGLDTDAPDAGAPRSVRANGEEHEIAISLEHSARDTTADGPEELLLSHFVTAGVLGRRFSVLEREEDGKTPTLVKWHMPRVANPPAHMLAAFVLRDQRGGVAFALRRLEIE